MGEKNIGLMAHQPILYKRMMLCRNLEQYVFTPALTTNQSSVVKQQITDALVYLETLKPYQLLEQPMEERHQQRYWMQRELLNSDPLKSNLKQGLYMAANRLIGISVNDMDHLRMTWQSEAESFEYIWQNLDLLDDDFSRHLDWAYLEPYGYLSAKIEQVGTGLVGEALLHLPALKQTGFIIALAESMGGIGIQIKPYKGNFYKVYNTMTLGRTEMEIAILLDQVAAKLVEREIAGRETLWASEELRIRDQIGRSFGMCQYASALEEDEAVKWLSDLLLGIDLGLINPGRNLTPDVAYNILLGLSDPGLEWLRQKTLKPRERLAERAEFLAVSVSGMKWWR